MMPSANFQLIFHYVMIILSAGYTEVKAQVHHGNQRNQSRDVYYTTTFDQDISRRSRSSTELPIVFKAPDIESQNFWNYNQQREPDRRTFFEDLKYLNYGSSNIFPNLNSFFEFMNPLLDRERTTKPKPQPVLKPSEPYKYEYPFKYQSTTERNFLPPPKPLRASIVKLETVAKAPDWQIPFRYIPSTVRLTQPSNIPSRPIDQIPTLYIDELGFHSDHNINFRRDSDWIPQKTPGEPFDEGQSTAPPFSTDLHFNVKSTSTGQQESVKNDPHASTLISIEDITEAPGNFRGESNDSISALTDDSSDKNSKSDDEENNKKALQLVITNTVNKYNMINSLKINRDISNNTVSNNAEMTESVKNIKPYNKSNTIKIVTDLTLEGLKKNKKNAVNVPRYTKLLNMSNLISYELNKFKQKQLIKPRFDFEGKSDKESNASRDGFLNGSDELSLDVKILKDTNWDGFTTIPQINFSSNEQSDSEKKQPVADGESEFLNAQNNSSENTENGKNQTIIVETRVTKSVSKQLPERKRYNRRKYYQITGGRDPRKEPDITQTAESDVGMKQPNLKIDVPPEETETKATQEIIFTMTEGNENIKIQEKGETVNRTVITLGKKFEVSQQNSTDDIQRPTEVIVNYRSRRRKYGPNVRNSPSYYSSINPTESTPLATTDTIEQKDELLNSTSTISNYGRTTERANNYTTYATTESPQLFIDAHIDTQIRRKKPKRTSKSKRRRTGKRRKLSSTTEKLSTLEDTTDSVSLLVS